MEGRGGRRGREGEGREGLPWTRPSLGGNGRQWGQVCRALHFLLRTMLCCCAKIVPIRNSHAERRDETNREALRMHSGSSAVVAIIFVVISRCHAATSVPHRVVRDCSMQSRNSTLALSPPQRCRRRQSINRLMVIHGVHRNILDSSVNVLQT